MLDMGIGSILEHSNYVHAQASVQHKKFFLQLQLLLAHPFLQPHFIKYNRLSGAGGFVVGTAAHKLPSIFFHPHRSALANF